MSLLVDSSVWIGMRTRKTAMAFQTYLNHLGTANLIATTGIIRLEVLAGAPTWEGDRSGKQPDFSSRRP